MFSNRLCYCSLDGLEKVTRPMCALSKAKVAAGQDSETRLLNIVQCCPETSVLGGSRPNIALLILM